MRRTSLAVITCCLIFTALTASAKKYYMWVDENGETHYSDNVPPEHIRKEHRLLSPQGIEFGRREPAKTPEQIERDKRLKELQAKQEQIRKEQEAKDRVLLRTFRSQDDLLMARNGKLAAVDAQIKLANSNVKRLKARLGNRQGQAAALERRGETASRNLRETIDQLRTQIENDYRYIVNREQEKLSISERYERDLQRFRQLQSLRPGEKPELESWQPSEAVVDTLVVCESPEQCQGYWERAKAFAKRHATTPLQISGERIYLTSDPVGNEDIAVTVSRLPANGSAEYIFLDVQCRSNSFGEELCKSARVRQIRESYREAVESST